MTRTIILVLALTGCGESMRGLNPIEMTGKAAGIYQGENPPPNTVYDQRNLETCDGVWKLRPGLSRITDFTLPSQTTIGLGEYIPDNRFEHSSYPVIIAEVLSGGYAIFRGIKNYSEYESLSLPVGFEHDKVAEYNKSSMLMHLWKSDGEYIPALVISNGYASPIVYHQKNGVGQLDLLGAIDGGFSDITYLSEPPRGKCMAVYKDRLFMANTPEASNRVWFTSTDSGGTFLCNVWPSGYNFDISQGEEIRALKVFRDQLIVFTASSIYAVTGDGVDGLWQVDSIDGTHGTINQHTVADIGDSLVFMDKDGIYRWAGGVAQRVSHPALQDTWEKISIKDGNTKHSYVVNDVAKHRVFFAAGSDESDVDLALVYNYKLNTWDVWGAWPEHNSRILPYGFPQSAMVVQRWGGFVAPKIVMIYKNMMYVFSGNEDKIASSYKYAIHWFLQTQRYWQGDSEIKTLRHIAVQAKKTGDWDMRIVSMVDDDDKLATITRNSPNSLIIIDSADSSNHDIDRYSGTWLDDTGINAAWVDVYHFPTFTKIGTYRCEYNIISGDIKFRDSIGNSINVDTRNLAGEVVVIPKDEAPCYSVDMEDGNTYDNSYYDRDIFSDPNLQKIIIPENATGRSFSLWLSNVGTYKDGDNWAKKGMDAEISGWGLWTMPKGRFRP